MNKFIQPSRKKSPPQSRFNVFRMELDRFLMECTVYQREGGGRKRKAPKKLEQHTKLPKESCAGGVVGTEDRQALFLEDFLRDCESQQGLGEW